MIELCQLAVSAQYPEYITSSHVVRACNVHAAMLGGGIRCVVLKLLRTLVWLGGYCTPHAPLRSTLLVLTGSGSSMLLCLLATCAGSRFENVLITRPHHQCAA